MDNDRLHYIIHGYSSFSGIFTPKKILEDKSSDQTSRWSSESNNPPQFLILKLECPAIVKSIKFGKFDRSHVCNLKRFVVYGAINERGYTELYSGGLKNDSTPEVFSLRHTLKNKCFPCLYVKIVPLQSWAVSFNYSIWYIELRGDKRPEMVQNAATFLNEYKHKEALRLCLKFLRQSNYHGIYNLLQKQSGVSLEHGIISTLYDTLVIKGDYEETEKLISNALLDGHFDEYIVQQPCSVEWSPVKISYSMNEQVSLSEQSPGPRGGHQMIIDILNNVIYLFGGYDGVQTLSDFWAFDLVNNLWIRLSDDTEKVGGPSPRSLHRMILDTTNSRIFCLGRYVPQNSQSKDLNSEFYVYSINENFWTLVSADTLSVGGPPLVYDHQLSIDTDNDVIYCCGGQVVDETSSAVSAEQRFAGLYSYHIRTDSWCLLKQDSCVDDKTIVSPNIKGRTGHSMEFDKVTQALYIVGGQRGSEYLMEVLIYDIIKNAITVIALHNDIVPTPISGFTQTSTIDEEGREIHIYMGFHKDRVEKNCCVLNYLYSYHIEYNEWRCLYRNGDNDNLMNDKNETPKRRGVLKGNNVSAVTKDANNFEPCARFAHQFVFHSSKKIYYLYGGNAAVESSNDFRLDDFWSLKLKKPDRREVMRRCELSIRKCKFDELLEEENSTAALLYLQRRVNPIVDKSDDEELTQLHDLASKIFLTDSKESSSHTEKRVELFKELNGYFQEEMTQPKCDLLDLVPI